MTAAMLAAIAATRFLTRSHYLYDLDSVNFALALRRFDPSVHQPHPPGYFLYICLGRAVQHFIPDANSALVAISIAASCGAAWMIYLLTRAWFGEGAARLSFVLSLVSPLFWFHGVVALTYVVEAFFSALIGYLCWRTRQGNTRAGIPASIAYAVAAGFRPSAALLLGPLWLVCIFRLDAARRLMAFVCAVIAGLAWFIPMIVASGGASVYFGSLAQLWFSVPGNRTTLQSPAMAVARSVTILWMLVVSLGTASLFAIGRMPDGKFNRSELKRFICLWIGPGLAFFSLVFFNYVNSGYILLVCPPIFAWISGKIHAFMATARFPSLRRLALLAGAAANCAAFLAAPYYWSHRSIREFEQQLRTITQTLDSGLDPNTTLVVGFDSHFLGYRHAGYYLPRFTTIEYHEIPYPGGERVFVLRGRNTELLAHLSVDQFQKFVFFPLPPDSEYADYVKGVVSKLPAGALETRNIGQLQVIGGPARLLSVLFPVTIGGANALMR